LKNTFLSVSKKSTITVDGCNSLQAEQFTHDAFLGKSLWISQPKKGYRCGIDPIFLAAAVPACEGDHILDVGCGVGAASFCLLKRVCAVQVVGLEMQKELSQLSASNAKKNDFSNCFQEVCQTLETYRPSLPFDHIVTNPPFYNSGTDSPYNSKRLAHREQNLTLKEWFSSSYKFLKPQGSLTTILHSERFTDCMETFYQKRVSFEVMPLWPKYNRSPKRLLIRVWKECSRPFRLLPGIVVHNDDGSFTSQANDVLIRGQALDFS
jgi:tRNA1(Val) A37 N6-methylase TrmN6